ncbi:MAG: glycoside hydrolase family 99-like domain-containing protein [Planctomycetes bacterium]|nr:glycoside hydrolase family 99-like domain-containing protein [Planctomycetota bacterium]
MIHFLLIQAVLSAPPAWTFSEASGWGGWTPSAEVRDAAFDGTCVSFRTDGTDPQILSPAFSFAPATNNQWVEIDIACDAAGDGELFFTNKTTGRYGGLEPAWMTPIAFGSAGRRSVRVWPFWGSLGEIIRIRFDPPAGIRARLYGIRIGEGVADEWQSFHAARIEREGEGLRAVAERPQAMLIRPVAPFDASRRSILRLDARCPGERTLGLYWVTREEPGLHGEPIELDGEGRAPDKIDLRTFETWRGSVTHLAIAFGTRGGETLAIRSFAIEANDPETPFLRLRHLGFDRPINRPGKPAEVRALLERVGGPRSGERFEVRRTIVPRAAGPVTVEIPADGQVFRRTLRVDPAVPEVARGDYDVPPPHPVKTDYEIGIYYFPGWSPDQLDRWKKQQDFPEREPVLGWYAEGKPEVADWHIKWAVENGISFFIYDWYWRNGKEELGAGLNDGFLKARYRDAMRFAVMWANHKPFADHTPEQLLAVTDTWIEHYFRRPNYLRVGGKPYASFFAPRELLSCLGSEEKVRAALDGMRARARAAGLPGIHIAACGGSAAGGLASLARAGFDSVTGYNYARTGAVAQQSVHRQFLLGHEAVWEALGGSGVVPYTPLLTVGWDSRPWHGPRAMRRFGRRSEDFAEGLARLKAYLDAKEERMAILEAWNEWGEGSYIEPNAGFGFEDLEAIRRTFCAPGDRPATIGPANIGPADVGLDGAYDLRRGLSAPSKP